MNFFNSVFIQQSRGSGARGNTFACEIAGMCRWAMRTGCDESEDEISALRFCCIACARIWRAPNGWMKQELHEWEWKNTKYHTRFHETVKQPFSSLCSDALTSARLWLLVFLWHDYLWRWCAPVVVYRCARTPMEVIKTEKCYMVCTLVFFFLWSWLHNKSSQSCNVLDVLGGVKVIY